MLRLFVKEADDIKDNILELKFSDHHYLTHVLKLKPGNKIELVIENLELFIVEIVAIQENKLSFLIKSKKRIEIQPLPKMTLAQCLPKQDKFSEIIRKCTELGIEYFAPVISARSIPQLNTDKKKSKLNRWLKILTSASSQSKQTKQPTLHPIMSLKEFLIFSRNSEFDMKILFWEEENALSLKEFLTNATTLPKKIIGFIGPEGGISEEEATLLAKEGFISVSLGSTVLRVENAGFSAFSNIIFHYGSARSLSKTHQ
jgi:16S rRNA (uracil1498-N3)-methyltransferase